MHNDVIYYAFYSPKKLEAFCQLCMQSSFGIVLSIAEGNAEVRQCQKFNPDEDHHKFTVWLPTIFKHLK